MLISLLQWGHFGFAWPRIRSKTCSLVSKTIECSPFRPIQAGSFSIQTPTMAANLSALILIVNNSDWRIDHRTHRIRSDFYSSQYDHGLIPIFSKNFS
jgi:hypothetical protein